MPPIFTGTIFRDYQGHLVPGGEQLLDFYHATLDRAPETGEIFKIVEVMEDRSGIMESVAYFLGEDGRGTPGIAVAWVNRYDGHTEWGTTNEEGKASLGWDRNSALGAGGEGKAAWDITVPGRAYDWLRNVGWRDNHWKLVPIFRLCEVVPTTPPPPSKTPEELMAMVSWITRATTTPQGVPYTPELRIKRIKEILG